jgi:hypothetical protein
MTHPDVEALLAAVPEIAALDRLCITAWDAGAKVCPVWELGPLTAHFVGRLAAEPWVFLGGSLAYDDLPGTAEQRHRAQQIRRTDEALLTLVRHLAGVDYDQPVQARVPAASACSPLLATGFEPIPVALARPTYERYRVQVDRAAADFQPARDGKFLDGRLACLLRVAGMIPDDQRPAAATDFEAVAATLCGPKRWDVAGGWDGGQYPLNWSWKHQSAALWAASILKCGAALTLVKRSWMSDWPQPVENVATLVERLRQNGVAV